jgi:DNA-binding MarR family transcriptional regulator
MNSLSRPRQHAPNARNASHTIVSLPTRAEDEALEIGELAKHLGYFVRRLQLWIFKDFIRTLAPVKVRPAQYSVLLVIEANPGHSQAAIGKTLNIERARLARLLHELEMRKLIERRSASKDARSHALFLTVTGKTTMARIKSLAIRHEVQVSEKLGARRRMLLLQLLKDWDDGGLASI